MKAIISIFGVLFVSLVFLYIFNAHKFTQTALQQKQPPLTQSVQNATYKINGIDVTLKDGESEVEAAPGSASKIVTRYFGNEIRHDFNADGREDAVFLITQTTGGSGTFFYAVVALNTQNGYVGSEGFFLGDRISPQTTEMSTKTGSNNVIVVNYADRKPDEAFSVPPSVGKSVQLIFDAATMQLRESV